MICLLKRQRSQSWVWLVGLLSIGLISIAVAQEKKPDNLPQLLMATPLGIAPGQTTKVLLRGKRLDEVKELRLNGQAAATKILNKSKVGVPQKQDANRAGDSQVEVEFTLPADTKPGECELVAVNDAGSSEVYKLLINTQAVLADKEPNDGFTQAQSIEIGSVIEGTLHQPQNVDIFRFEGKAGEKLVCEIVAARRGSVLDALLTLFDARQKLIATADDLPAVASQAPLTTNEDLGRRDAKLEITLPTSGVFYLALQDAHDLGGPAHPYRLIVTRSGPP